LDEFGKVNAGAGIPPRDIPFEGKITSPLNLAARSDQDKK